MKPLVEVKDLSVGFRLAGKLCPAVDRVSFEVYPGETVGLVGESGCGKSLTSLALMRLLPTPPAEVLPGGQVVFSGRNVLELPESGMRALRGRDMSMIFQEPMTSLNPVFTVGEQISEVFRRHLGVSRRVAHGMSVEMLEKVKVPSPEKRVNEYPHQLSGGMRQRVMIAIALACKPSFLIADEPTTALDVTIQAQILSLMKSLNEELGTSILLITHDLGVVAEVCDRVLVMYAGSVVESATTEQLFTSPQHPYTRGLLDSIPRLGSRLSKLHSIEGAVPELGDRGSGCVFAPRCQYAEPHCHETKPDLKSHIEGHSVACFLSQGLFNRSGRSPAPQVSAGRVSVTSDPKKNQKAEAGKRAEVLPLIKHQEGGLNAPH